jgi:hypothetical protein
MHLTGGVGGWLEGAEHLGGEVEPIAAGTEAAADTAHLGRFDDV